VSIDACRNLDDDPHDDDSHDDDPHDDDPHTEEEPWDA
jgi:hypothetical protein